MKKQHLILVQVTAPMAGLSAHGKTLTQENTQKQSGELNLINCEREFFLDFLLLLICSHKSLENYSKFFPEKNYIEPPVWI